MKNSKQDDIAIKIDTALHEIELKNTSLSGALPDNYYSRLGLESNVLSSLLDKLNNISLCSKHDNDVFWRIYEYSLSHFSIQEGKGEYYTPKTVVALLFELIEPFKEIVYDGTCGSGGMFVQSMKFIDQHKNLKIDYILMNPPFNQKDWREESELADDSRLVGYKIPPKSSANYAWILNFISKLSQNGTGCLLLANGALSADGVKYEKRKQIIENDLVEAILILPPNIFYSTDISVTIWIFNKNKKERTDSKSGVDFVFRNREKEILFLYLRKKGHLYEKIY